MESMTEGGAQSKTKGALEGVKEQLTGGDDDDDEKDRQKSSSRRRSSSRVSRSSRIVALALEPQKSSSDRRPDAIYVYGVLRAADASRLRSPPWRSDECARSRTPTWPRS